MMDGWTVGGSWWGTSMMILFWVGLIVTVLLIVRAIDRGRDLDDRRPPRIEPDAKEILDARFARGEISREEYEQRSEVLAGRV